MAKLEVLTVEGIKLELDVAGPGTRFVAGLLDGLVLSGLLLTALLALSVLQGLDVTGASSFMLGFLTLGAALVLIGYHVFFHAFTGGQTPGKRALGIAVVGADGQPAGLAALCLRGVLMLVDLLPVPLSLGLIAIGLTPRRQRLGDLVADTLVVRLPRQEGQALEPWGQETWSQLQVRVLDLTPAAAARFEREDLAFLRELVTRRGMEPGRRADLLREVAAHYRMRLGRTEDEDPRAVIRELYLFLREHRAALGH